MVPMHRAQIGATLDFMLPFVVTSAGAQQVEVWSAYQVQFPGFRRFAWQEDLVADLREALAGICHAGSVLAGLYLTTESTRCDAENRLFLNPDKAMPKHLAGVRFETAPVTPPAPPDLLDLVDGGGLHYYRYRRDGNWSHWRPHEVVARWERVARRFIDDQSAKSVWAAMRRAVIDGRVQFSGARIDAGAPFGVRLVVHGTAMGPRSVGAVRESVIDGTIAAFHSDVWSEGAGSALVRSLRGLTNEEAVELLSCSPAQALFSVPAIRANPNGVQISPSDEWCYAGELLLRRDAAGPVPELSGEIFTLTPATAGAQR